MAKDKTTFVIYSQWQENMDNFPEDVQNEIRKAIFFYAMGRELPEMSPRAEGFFWGIKSQMDANTKKYEELSQKRREAGQKSGESRKTKRTSVDFVEQNEQKGTKRTSVDFVEHNDNVNDNDNVNVNENVPLNNGGYNIKDTPQENLENKAREFIETYNKLVEGTKIPQARVTENRTIRTGKILYKMGWDTMVEVIQKASKSILAKDNMWVGFDWFLDEDNVVKVLEGTYDDTAANNNQGQGAKGFGMGIQEQRHIRQLRELAGGDEEQFKRLMETAGYNSE
jgi:hypothetical protein